MTNDQSVLVPALGQHRDRLDDRGGRVRGDDRVRRVHSFLPIRSVSHPPVPTLIGPPAPVASPPATTLNTTSEARHAWTPSFSRPARAPGSAHTPKPPPNRSSTCRGARSSTGS